LLGSLADVAGLAFPAARARSLVEASSVGAGLGGVFGALQPVLPGESRVPGAVANAAVGAVLGPAARAFTPRPKVPVPEQVGGPMVPVPERLPADVPRGTWDEFPENVSWEWIERSQKLGPPEGTGSFQKFLDAVQLPGGTLPAPKPVKRFPGPRAQPEVDVPRGTLPLPERLALPGPPERLALPSPERIENDIITLPVEELGDPHRDYFVSKVAQSEPQAGGDVRKLWKLTFPGMDFKKFTVTRATMFGLSAGALTMAPREPEFTPPDVPTQEDREYQYGPLEGRDPEIQASLDYMDDIGKEGAVEKFGRRMAEIEGPIVESADPYVSEIPPNEYRYKPLSEEIRGGERPVEMGMFPSGVLNRVMGRAATNQAGGAVASAVQQGVPKAPGFFSAATKDFADMFGRKSITYIDELGKVSPTARRLRNQIEHEEQGEVPMGPDYYENLMERRGHFVRQLKDIVDEYRTPGLGVLKPETAVSLTESMRRGSHGPLRRLMNDLHDYARKSGLDLGFIENYFPRVYDKDVLADPGKAAEFVSVLQRYGGMSQDAAEDVLRTVTSGDGMVLTKDSFSIPAAARVHGFKGKGVIGPEHTRTLARIPDEVLAPFLRSNVYDVLQTYINGVVKRSEYAKIFGASDEKLVASIADIRKEAKAAGYAYTQKEENRILEISDYLKGVSGRIESVPLRKAGRFISTYQVLRTMPLSVLSSLAEPLITLERGHARDILKSIPDVMSHVGHGLIHAAWKKFPKADITRAAEDVLGGMDEAFAGMLEGDFMGNLGRAVSKGFFTLNLLEPWTRLNRVMAFSTGQRMIERLLGDLSSGTSSGSRMARSLMELRELGIDEVAGMRWVKAGADRNDPFWKSVQLGAARFVNDVVMSPRVANKPLWMSNEHFALVSQLKGYNTVFGNTVLKRWLRKVTKGSAYDRSKVASTVGLMVGVMMLSNELREYVKYGPAGNPKTKDAPWYAKVGMAADRLGLTGAFQPLVDMTYGYRFGTSGISQGMGPLASQTEQALGGAGMAMKGDPDKLRKEFINAIPLLNANFRFRKWLEVQMGAEDKSGKWAPKARKWKKEWE
jgi:hypothetical protein